MDDGWMCIEQRKGFPRTAKNKFSSNYDCCFIFIHHIFWHDEKGNHLFMSYFHCKNEIKKQIPIKGRKKELADVQRAVQISFFFAFVFAVLRFCT
jgi:hypothetical protein